MKIYIIRPKKVNMFKNEKEFQRWFGQQCKKNGWFYFKIPDDSRGMKPYDCIVRTHDVDMHCELKVSPSIAKMTGEKAWKLLRPQQKASLWRVTQLGGCGVISIYGKKEDKASHYVLCDCDGSRCFIETPELLEANP